MTSEEIRNILLKIIEEGSEEELLRLKETLENLLQEAKEGR